MLKRKKSPKHYFSDDSPLVDLRKADNDLLFQEIIPGSVYSRILIDPESSVIRYELAEPEINEDLHAYLRELEKIYSEISTTEGKSTISRRRKFVDDFLSKVSAKNVQTTSLNLRKLQYYTERDVLGYGKIDGLLRDPNIEDISCNGADTPVYVYHRSYGYIPTNVSFKSEDELNKFIRKTVQDSGKHISITSPIIDSTIYDGSRIQASLGRHVTTNGPSFTIRKFRAEPISIVDLINFGTATSEIFAYLWLLTEYGTNVIVSGGTASGKTTFLNSLLSFIPPEQKIVTIEDTRELNLKHENWISLLTRPGYGRVNPETGKKAGEIDMFDLLSASLRHRPNYIIIGEVRGREAFTVFQAMSVGRYSMGTFHAEDIGTLIHRLESKPINIPRPLITSLDVVITLSMLKVGKSMVRKLDTVSEIAEIDQATNDIIVNNIYGWKSEAISYEYSGYSYIIRRLAERTGETMKNLMEEIVVRKLFLDKMAERGICKFSDVTKQINRFYRDRPKVMEEFGI